MHCIVLKKLAEVAKYVIGFGGDTDSVAAYAFMFYGFNNFTLNCI
jgi:hypothetical protein